MTNMCCHLYSDAVIVTTMRRSFYCLLASLIVVNLLSLLGCIYLQHFCIDGCFKTYVSNPCGNGLEIHIGLTPHILSRACHKR